MPLAQAASAPCACGQISPIPRSLACMAASKVPGDGVSYQSSPSSPTATKADKESAATAPSAQSSARAIGKS